MAKRFLNEGLEVISDVTRVTPGEPVESVIERTVQKFIDLGVEGTIGVLGNAPDISKTVAVKVVPWKELTEIGKAVEKKECFKPFQ